MSIQNHSLIVVTPVYEDIEASSRLFKELALQFQRDIFVVAVDDGSVQQVLDISSLKDAGVQGTILKLRRNVGHQRAIAIGLGYVSEYILAYQRVVVMDSDGEDLPSTIPILLDKLQSEQVDVAVAQRKSRVETFRFKAFYAVYKRFFSLMTGRSISFGNFMALKSDAVKRLVAMRELSIHIAAATLSSKLRMVTCPLDRGPRYAGQSKMNFVGLALHGFKGLMVFAEDVLVRVGIACACIASLSVVGALAAIMLKLLGFSTPGWFSVALGILVLMFLQTGALALMTLMLTGVVRGGTVTTAIVYQNAIDSVITQVEVV
jgi:polyisoprenyl-phosphate glycosyltransferase